MFNVAIDRGTWVWYSTKVLESFSRKIVPEIIERRIIFKNVFFILNWSDVDYAFF